MEINTAGISTENNSDGVVNTPNNINNATCINQANPSKKDIWDSLFLILELPIISAAKYTAKNPFPPTNSETEKDKIAVDNNSTG